MKTPIKKHCIRPGEFCLPELFNPPPLLAAQLRAADQNVKAKLQADPRFRGSAKNLPLSWYFELAIHPNTHFLESALLYYILWSAFSSRGRERDFIIIDSALYPKLAEGCPERVPDVDPALVIPDADKKARTLLKGFTYEQN